jgi:bacterial/archaeal transporter family protein
MNGYPGNIRNREKIMGAIILLIIATVLWGFWGFSEKNAVLRAHPYTVQWMYSIPYVLSIPIWYWLGLKAAPEANFSLPALSWALAAGLASIGALVLLLFAMQTKPASLAVAITAAYPVVTMLLAVISGAESFSLPRLIGIMLVIAGIIVILNSH